jgi:hypothetical protein
MTTRELILLGVLFWWAFRRRPVGTSAVRLTITEPGFEDLVMYEWPPI